MKETFPHFQNQVWKKKPHSLCLSSITTTTAISLSFKYSFTHIILCCPCSLFPYLLSCESKHCNLTQPIEVAAWRISWILWLFASLTSLWLQGQILPRMYNKNVKNMKSIALPRLILQWLFPAEGLNIKALPMLRLSLPPDWMSLLPTVSKKKSSKWLLFPKNRYIRNGLAGLANT